MWIPINWSWHVQNLPFVPIRLARPRILRGPKHVVLDRNGTNDHEQPRSVPLVPMLSGRVNKRHALATSYDTYGKKDRRETDKAKNAPKYEGVLYIRGTK